MSPSFYVNLGPIKLGQIASLISAEIDGLDPNIEFKEFLGIDEVRRIDHTIYFIYENYKKKINLPESANLIISKHEKQKYSKFENLILVDNVHEAVAKLSSLFYRDINDDDLKEDGQKQFSDNCIISSTAVIKKGVVIGKNSIIKDGVVIGNNCILGENTLIEENVVISNAIIGDNVRLGRNTSIGQPGFGFAVNNFSNHKIFHLGRVILQSNVNIGSNCCIDRGSFGDTVVGENTYFDNLCHIAHNVVIGNNCIFAAMAGIAGSSIIGDNVMAGGQVGISGHLNIGNNVQIAAKSAVLKNIDDNCSVMGNPAIDKYKYIRKYKKIYG
tara:strand:+ start:5945 stop:6928 length:984 start_codon:yes stop_codon:yes gene_type:complete